MSVQLQIIDGNFTIRTKKGDVLEFSYVGYTVQNVTITGNATLNIVLQEDNAVLDEVVVTDIGYQAFGQGIEL